MLEESKNPRLISLIRSVLGLGRVRIYTRRLRLKRPIRRFSCFGGREYKTYKTHETYKKFLMFGRMRV